MFLKKLLSTILSVSVFTTSLPALGQTATSTVGQFTILNKGEKIPFDGVVFDMLGNAIVLTDREQVIEKHKLEVQELQEKMQAERNKDVANLELRNLIQEKESNARIKIMSEELDKTRKIATNNGSSSVLWGLGGFALGIATVISTLLIVEKNRND